MTRTMILGLAAGAATLATAAAPVSAQRWRQNWRTIAYTTVSGRDNDTIRVPGTARYRQLRLCVYYAPLTMRDFDVRYRNGGHQDINVRQRIRANTCTRNIDLKGSRRDVSAIRLKYTAIRHGWTRPLVRVQVR
jgi:hypothetical protein